MGGTRSIGPPAHIYADHLRGVQWGAGERPTEDQAGWGTNPIAAGQADINTGPITVEGFNAAAKEAARGNPPGLMVSPSDMWVAVVEPIGNADGQEAHPLRTS